MSVDAIGDLEEMTTGDVEKLCERLEAWSYKAWSLDGDAPPPSMIMHEAAAMLRSLAAEKEILQLELTQWRDVDRGEHKAEIASLHTLLEAAKKDRDWALEGSMKANAKLERAHAELRDLRSIIKGLA